MKALELVLLLQPECVFSLLNNSFNTRQEFVMEDFSELDGICGNSGRSVGKIEGKVGKIGGKSRIKRKEIYVNFQAICARA